MDVSALPLGSIGATGILALVVLLIVRGGIIPRSTHEDRMKDKDNQIDYYRTALSRETKRNDELVHQLGTLMEVARTAEHVLTSLPMAARPGEEGRDEVAS